MILKREAPRELFEERGEDKRRVPVFLKFSNNASPVKWIMFHFNEMAEHKRSICAFIC